MYELKIGDIFTEQKSRELIEYLKAKDNDLEEALAGQKEDLIKKIEEISFKEAISGKKMIWLEELTNLIK